MFVLDFPEFTTYSECRSRILPHLNHPLSLGVTPLARAPLDRYMTLPVTADLENTAIVPEVAEQFRISLGLEETPETLATWAEATSETLNHGFRNNIPQRSAAEAFRHKVRVNQDTYYCQGLFEAMVLPFVSKEATEFQIRSRSPLSGSDVEIRATCDSLSVNPEEALTSFGVAENVVTAEYFDVPPDIAYHRFNQYTNVFPDERAYDYWTERTDDVVVMALPIPDALVLTQRVIEGWDDKNGFSGSGSE